MCGEQKQKVPEVNTKKWAWSASVCLHFHLCERTVGVKLRTQENIYYNTMCGRFSSRV